MVSFHPPTTPNAQLPTPKASLFEEIPLGVGSWKLGVDKHFIRFSSSVHANRRGRGQAAEGANPADAVPRVRSAGLLTLPLVALEEAGHEKLLRERRQLHAPRLTVLDDSCRIVQIDHF